MNTLPLSVRICEGTPNRRIANGSRHHVDRDAEQRVVTDTGHDPGLAAIGDPHAIDDIRLPHNSIDRDRSHRLKSDRFRFPACGLINRRRTRHR